jgi:hypothetical protein
MKVLKAGLSQSTTEIFMLSQVMTASMSRAEMTVPELL